VSKITQPLIPSLIVDDGVAAIEFYVRAFGARERYRLVEEGGKIAHAEIELEGGVIMLAEEYPELQCVSPKKLAGVASSVTVYVADVDRLVERATAAGAKAERPTTDEFYGDRTAWLRDPFGHRWSFHTRREELTSDEIQRRYAALIAGS
jgi:PhnB protein